MSNQMSTSIDNLPVVDISTAPPVNNDPLVTDVLAEMEREVAAAQRPVSHQPPVQIAPSQYVHPPPSAHMLPPYMKEPSKPLVDTQKLQTAVIASLIAVLLLIPNVSFLYEKFERLSQVRSYETFIRVGLLALVLYVAMVKLNI